MPDTENTSVPDSSPTEVSPVDVPPENPTPANARKCQECGRQHGSGVVVTSVVMSIHKPTSRNTGRMVEETILVCSAPCHSKALQKFFNKHYPPNVHGLAWQSAREPASLATGLATHTSLSACLR